MKKKLFIEGMTCNHCVMHVESSLKSLEGVKDVKVNLKGKFAMVEFEKDINNKVLAEVVKEAGYSLEEVKE